MISAAKALVWVTDETHEFMVRPHGVGLSRRPAAILIIKSYAHSKR
jgi:hypothetical protein